MSDVHQSDNSIWTYVKELAMVVWGPNKDNGLRSVVQEHEKRLDAQDVVLNDLHHDFKSFVKSGRKMTCYGLVELARRDKEDVTLRTTGINAKAAIIAAVASSAISAMASIAVVLITLFFRR